MKLILNLLAFDIIISLLYTIIRNFSNFSFINCFFIIGMAYFLVGAFCFVLEKGFFNITIFSFNKISQQIQKRSGVFVDEDNVTLDEYITRTNHFQLTNSLLLCGGLISFVSIFISFMYL